MQATHVASRAGALLGLLGAAALVGPAALGAQSPGRPIPLGEAHTIRSSVLDEDREVLVALPQGYDRTGVTYPVLFLLDGSSHLLHGAATTRFLANARNRIPEMIVVAIPNTNRNRDLTPGPGASAFQRFFAEDLIPWVEREYRAAPERVIMGHSLGGSFVVHTLLNRVELFDAYVAVSAPLWRYEGLAADAERGLPAAARAGAALYLTVGEHENERLRDGVARFAARLEAGGSGSVPAWSYAVLEDEDHSSTPSRSLYAALEARYAEWRLPFFEEAEELEALGGLRGLEAHYRRFSERFGFASPPPESRVLQVGRIYIEADRHAALQELAEAYIPHYPALSEALINVAGYDQLRRGRAEDALRLFRRNVELFPDSPNVHDSLGDGYCRSGDAESARQSYRRAADVAEARSHPRLAFYRGKAERGCEL